MTLETIYYITQIVAVAAILASLVAIYIQQRKDHELARAEHQRETGDEYNKFYEYITQDPDALDCIKACFQDYEGATSKEQAKFGYLIHLGINIADKTLELLNRKLVSVEHYASAIELSHMLLNTPGGRQYRKRSRLVYGAFIRAELDKALSEQKDGPMIWDLLPFFAPNPPVQPAVDELQEALDV